jgi:DNA polymerase III alpha subunit
MKELKTDLGDRILRFDGVSEVQPDQLAQYLLLGIAPSQLRVAGSEADVAQFNEQVAAEDELRIAGPEPINIDLTWQLPKKYMELNLEIHMFGTLEERMGLVQSSPEMKDLDYDMTELHKAMCRVQAELDEVKKRGMEEFMRTVIFILDELKKNNVVWGVGRGSSCASYLLFLIGLHVVDCVKMDVPMEEFFHE